MDEVHEVTNGFVPVVRTEAAVRLHNAGAMAVLAGGDASINDGGTGWFIAGGDLTMSSAGAGNMVVGGGADLTESAVGNLLARGATLTDSRVGVLLAGNATLNDSTVVLNTQQAIGLGVAVGVTLFGLSRLFRRS